MRPSILWVLESPKLNELFTSPQAGVVVFTDEIEAGRAASGLQQMLAQAVQDGIAGKEVDTRDWRPARAFIVQYPSFMYERYEPGYQVTTSLLRTIEKYLAGRPELAALPQEQFEEAVRFEWVVGV